MWLLQVLWKRGINTSQALTLTVDGGVISRWCQWLKYLVAFAFSTRMWSFLASVFAIDRVKSYSPDAVSSADTVRVWQHTIHTIVLYQCSILFVVFDFSTRMWNSLASVSAIDRGLRFVWRQRALSNGQTEAPAVYWGIYVHSCVRSLLVISSTALLSRGCLIY